MYLYFANKNTIPKRGFTRFHHTAKGVHDTKKIKTSALEPKK